MVRWFDVVNGVSPVWVCLPMTLTGCTGSKRVGDPDVADLRIIRVEPDIDAAAFDPRALAELCARRGCGRGGNVEGIAAAEQADDAFVKPEAAERNAFGRIAARAHLRHRRVAMISGLAEIA